jgi:hypothetical protein
LSSKFPSPVILQTEEGIPRGLTVSTFGLQDTFKGALSCMSFLGTEPHDHRTLVVDSLDPLEPLVWREACVANGWASIEQPGYGKGYVIADIFWLDFLAGLDFLRRERAMTIVLLAHSAIERIDDPRAVSYTSYQLRLHKRARGLVQDWADAILFLAPDLNIQTEDAGFGKKRTRADGGSNRWLHCEGRPSFVAKNRYGMPPKIMIPKDFNFGAALAPFFPPAAAE